MLALFYGTDRTDIRDSAQAYLKENGLGDGVASQVSEHDYAVGKVVESIAAQSLFGGTEFFILDTPSADSEFESEVLSNLDELASSPNVFVVLENALLAPAKKKYQKHSSVIEEKNASTAERFNVFQIAEALAQKDKKRMWVLLQQARSLGIRDEETIGILWWQLKALRLAAETKTAEEAGMKDYPYRKAKQALSGFKAGEINTLMHSLLVLYHEGHQGTKELDLSLEGWVLGA